MHLNATVTDLLLTPGHIWDAVLQDCQSHETPEQYLSDIDEKCSEFMNQGVYWSRESLFETFRDLWNTILKGI
jgi:hypothetical protein